MITHILTVILLILGNKVLSASCVYSNSEISWFENDGNESFTDHNIITNVEEFRSVYAADLNGDGNMDILSASRFNDTVSWYENDGDENFVSYNITTNADGASSVYAIDMDNDDDMDVLSASFNDCKIAWYENLQITEINDNNNLMQEFNNLTNFPNPFNPTTNIAFSLDDATHITLEVYNIKGEKVITLVDNELPADHHNVIWNGKDSNKKQVSSGVYFYKMKAGNYQETKKMILMK